MTSSDLVELLIGISQKLDVLWQIFIAVHVAIFSLVFIYFDRFQAINYAWKILILAGYCMFLGLNYTALSGTYSSLALVQRQLRFAMAERAAEFDPLFWQNFINSELVGRPEMLLVTHGFALGSVGFALLFGSLISSRRRSKVTQRQWR